METKIYSIVYDKNQIVEYEKYDNSHIKTIEQRSYFFEYNVLMDVIDNHNIAEDYLGIFSYKFPMKTGLFKKKLFKILEQNPNYDVYTFCSHRVKLKGKYLEFTEKVHPGFLDLFNKLCNDLGLVVKEPKYIVGITLDQPQTTKYGGTAAGPVFKEIMSELLTKNYN